MQRAIAHTEVQNYLDAINDLTAYLQIDSTSTLAYWQRAVCQCRISMYETSKGMDAKLRIASALSDFEKALKKDNKNAYLYYNIGNIYAQNKDYTKAITFYDKALKIDSRLAEAYYNRGLANIYNKKTTIGISDLSKAGELGIYDAYSAIKKFK